MNLIWPSLIFIIATVWSCCNMPCQTPPINITYTGNGLQLDCTQNATCAWVRNELETCTCGKQWKNDSHMTWRDPRFKQCVAIKQHDNYANLHGVIRWWTNKCMGHHFVNLKFILAPVSRHVFLSFEDVSHAHIVKTSIGIDAKAKSGSEDEIPMAGKSEMFFECVLNETMTGLHMEIISCDIDILDSGKADAEVIRTFSKIPVNTSYAEPNGEKASYTAFMDTEFYSPWQRLICLYGLYNGTTSVETFTHGKSYMLLNPFDTGTRYT